MRSRLFISRKVISFTAPMLCVLFSISLAATEGYGRESDTGTFTIGLNTVRTLNGHNATLTITITNPVPFGFFDLYLQYTQPGLAFKYADKSGQLLQWEYFTYRYWSEDSCGGGCRRYCIRLIGIADMPNGIDPGDVYRLQGEVVKLTFDVTEDRSYAGQCFSVDWSWPNCAMNVISSIHKDTLFHAWNVAALLPDSACLDRDSQRVHLPILHFQNGKIGIMPIDFHTAGDCTGDSRIDAADAAFWVAYVFNNGPEPPSDRFCGGACRADFTCDHKLNLVDLARLVRYVYRQPAPGPCNLCPDK